MHGSGHPLATDTSQEAIMKRVLLSALFAAVCMTSTRADDVVEPVHPDIVVHKRPPHAVKERRPPSPGHEYMWIEGYQQWNGTTYAWQPGHWEKPPHDQAIWMAPRWQRREGGYVFTPGWWT
jgi:hypothetical protein